MAIEINDTTIVVNLDVFVKQYYINSSFEYLLATLNLLQPQIKNKTLEINASVQTPLALHPFRAIIDAIADATNLPPDRIIIKTRNRDLFHPRATVEVLNNQNFFSFARSILFELQKLEFALEHTPVLFGALFGRPSYPRLILGHHLETVHPNNSYVTFLSGMQHVHDNVGPVKDFFQKQLVWAETRCNPIDAQKADSHLGALNFPENIRCWPKIWGKYFIEIVVETDYHNRTDWTEKTWKCLGSGKPFISMCGSGSLKHMKDLGFQTFHPWIDETYDLEKNDWNRLQLIKKEIDRLANLHESQLLDILYAIEKIGNANDG